jgi:hypothetical protein
VPLHSFRTAAGAAKHLSKPPWGIVDTKPTTAGGAANACVGVSRRQQLSGCEWGFKVFPNPAAVPEGFWQPGFDDSGFGKVGTGLAAHGGGDGVGYSAMQCDTCRIVHNARQGSRVPPSGHSTRLCVCVYPAGVSTWEHTFVLCTECILLLTCCCCCCCCCRSLCPATGSATDMAHPSTPTVCGFWGEGACD